MTDGPDRRQIVVGVSGASGAAYARRLVQCLLEAGVVVHLVASEVGRRVLAEETGIQSLDGPSFGGRANAGLHVYRHSEVGARIASGSFHTHGMIICPCSTNTLAKVAGGLSPESTPVGNAPWRKPRSVSRPPQ